MFPIKLPGLIFPLLACCMPAAADHNPVAEWSWHVVSAGADESRLSIHQRDRLLGIYDLSCDLTDAGEGLQADNGPSLDLVYPDSSPGGLLLVSCNVGAHSQQIWIIDLEKRSNKPVFSVTGSYAASWEIQDGELWIGFDEPCDTGPSVECPDGYETRFVQYPDPEAAD